MSSSSRGPIGRPIIAFFAVAAVVVAIGLGGWAWQRQVQESRTDEARSHAAAATLLTEVDKEAEAAATLLRQYVRQGDPAVLPEIEAHITAGVESLTAALAASGEDDLKVLGKQGTALSEGAGKVIALRASGDVAGAAQMLEELSPKLEGFKEGLQTGSAAEMARASSLSRNAEKADDAASSLLIVAVAAAAVMTLVLTFAVGRLILRREVTKRPSAA